MTRPVSFSQRVGSNFYTDLHGVPSRRWKLLWDGFQLPAVSRQLELVDRMILVGGIVVGAGGRDVLAV